MHKPPVFYALVQVKFNAVQMERFVPDFREALRRSGFPDFQEDSQTELLVSLSEGAKQSKQRLRNRWRFLNMERTEGFTLLDDALVYHTNRYDCFTHCRDVTLEALSTLHQQVGLAYVERVGMRYLDAVAPCPDGSLTELVKPALLGPYSELPGDLDHSFSETRKIVDGGNLVLRTLVNEKGLAIPPDLNNQTLNLENDLKNYRGDMLLMDTDYFVEKRFKFALSDIEKQFETSHAILIETFKATLTDEAKDRWEL